MSDEDEEPSADELREAEALARAIERGHAPGGAPDDALGAAALLRYARDGGALGAERQDEILKDVLASAKRPRAALPWRFRLLGLLGLAAAGAAAVIVALRYPAPGPAASLPEPPRRLLEAQVQAAGARTASPEVLSTEMEPYRVAVYGALRERYGR